MAEDRRKPREFPFTVVTDQLVSVQGFDSREMAESNAEMRNGKAVELGIEARYAVVENEV